MLFNPTCALYSVTLYLSPQYINANDKQCKKTTNNRSYFVFKL